jgi:hypothetical protein
MGSGSLILGPSPISKSINAPSPITNSHASRSPVKTRAQVEKFFFSPTSKIAKRQANNKQSHLNGVTQSKVELGEKDP